MRIGVLPDDISHHAYALVGGEPTRVELVKTLEKKHAVSVRGNPDFFSRSYENFTIDDARAVKSLSETKPVREGSRKIFLLTISAITTEAQNALLKLLEEPAEYVVFFLIIPSRHLLLPTVTSRLALLDGERESEAYDQAFVHEFIQAAPAARLKIIQSFLDDIAKERRTKQEAVDFLNAVQKFLYEERGPVRGLKALEAVEIARKYMTDRAPSLKMLFEYAALAI